MHGKKVEAGKCLTSACCRSLSSSLSWTNTRTMAEASGKSDQMFQLGISTLGLHIFSKVPPGDGGSAEGATTEKEGFAEARR